MRRWTWLGAAVATLVALLAVPALAGAANPANTFVIGWQKYTKTGQSDQPRFMTWRIGTSGSLSGSAVYTSSAGFEPLDTWSYKSMSSIDYVSAPRMQVTPDGRHLIVLGVQYNQIQLRSYEVRSDGTLVQAGTANAGDTSAFTISPNGKWLYGVSSAGITLYPLSGGGIGAGVYQARPAVQYVAVSPNSKYLVWSGGSEYGVFSIADNGSLTATSARGTGAGGMVSFSPNGSVMTITGGRGRGLVRAVAFNQNDGTFGSNLSLSNASYWAGDLAHWSLDSKYVAFSGLGGGTYGVGCIYSCPYASSATVTGNGGTLQGTTTLMFDNESNLQMTSLGTLYPARSGALSPDGDTLYLLTYRRSNYRSFAHTIESYSFRNGSLARAGSVQVCSDYYDAGNSQTPGRGDNCGGPYEITSTRPSLNITAMTPAVEFTNQSSWTYQVTFNQSVTGLAKGDFSLQGTASGFTVSNVTGSGAGPYTVTVAKSVPSPTEGTVILRLAPNSVADSQGTTGPAASFADTLVASAVTYDVTPPTVTVTPPASPLNTVTPAYALAFSEPIQAADLATGDFTTTGTTTTTFSITSVTPNTGNVTSGTVNLTGTSSAANGDLVLSMSANTVRDRAGNLGPTAARSGTATVSFAPNNTAVPTVAGTMGTGETLSVGGNTWTGLAPITFAYQWQSSLDGSTGWADVASGGTSATYKIPTTGGGLHYRVQVTATNARGSSSPVISAGRGPAAISPVMLMTHTTGDKVTTLAIRADGTLDTTSTPENTGIDGANSAVVTPDRRFVYVVAYQSSRVYGYATDPGGALSPITVTTGQGWISTGSCPVGAAISGDGRFLYVFNRCNNTISQFSIGRNGTLAPLSPATVGAQSDGAWIGTNPDGTYLYTVSNRTTRDNNPYQGRLREYRIGSNGQLTSLRGEQAITGDAQMLAFTPNGKFAYTMSYRAGDDPCGFADWGTCDHPGRWQRFSVVQTGADTGRLNLLQTVDYNHLYRGQVSQDGQTLWMLKKSDGTLLRYRINQDTGALTDLATYDAGDIAHRMALSPDGSYLYVTAERSGDKVFQYSLSPTGVPTPLGTASFSTSGGEAGRNGFGPSFTPLFGVQKFEALPLGSGQTRTNSVDYEIIFTRPVTGLEASDFEIGGSAQGMALSALTDQGNGRWTFTVSKAGSATGTVEVTLKPDSVVDRFGTAGPSTSGLWTALRTTPTITLDYDPPVVSAFSNTATVTDAGASGPSTSVQAIEGGWSHFCAIVGAGASSTVKCWGINSSGELGDGTMQRRTGPVTAVGVLGATAIDVDGSNSCALLSNGTVKCWGSMVLKEDGTMGVASTPQTVPGLTGATAISNSQSHFCALVTGGAIRCWGYNMFGEVGDGTQASPRTTPTTVPGITGATGVEAWGNSTCAILASGTVSCWGTRYGQTPSPATSPVAVSGLTGVTALEGNNRHICARVGSGATGSVRCWGELGVDIAGIGRTGNITTPAQVIGVTGAMPTTHNAHYCFLEANGTAKCSGMNTYGALLNGSTATTVTTPAVTASLLTGTPALDLAASVQSTCVLLQSGPVRCAGSNANGELGSQLAGGAQSSTALVTVPGLEDGCSAAGRYQMEFSLTFGASVTGLTCSDVANAGTSSGWSARIVSGSGTGPYVVQMSANTLNEGTVIPRLAANSVQGSVSPGPAAPADGATQTLAKPAPRSVPTTSGSSAAAGNTLTVTAPTFGASAPAWAGSPTPTLAYQWQVSPDGGTTWVNATGAGATGTSYTVAAGDVGKRHRAVVTATNLLGATTEYSKQVTSGATPSGPGLVSFGRSASSDDTSASTVTFTALFSHVPQGLTASDFRPTGTATGWGVQSMTGSGVGPYVITLGGSATGAGTLGLELRADSTTVGHDSYPAGAPVETDTGYSVTRVPPAVGLFAQSDATATTRTYSLVFDAAIDPTTLTAADLSIGGTASGYTVTSITGTGAGPYTIVLTGTGSGTVIPTLAANAVATPGGTIGPAAAATGETGTTATWSEPASPTNAASLVYTLTFSRAVTGFDATDLTLSGTATGCSAGVTGSGSTYTVTLSSCSAGTVGIRLAAGAVASGVPEANVDATTVTRDTGAPTVASFTATTPTNATAIGYTLTFSEPVTGLTPSDVTVGGTATGWSVTSVTGSGAGPYTVLVGGASATAGTVIPTLAANAVRDLAGNQGPTATSTGTTVTSDRTAPTMTGLAPGSPAVNGTTMTYTLTTSEPVSGLTPADFQIGGTSTGWAVTTVSPASGSASTFVITVAGTSPTAGTVIPTLRQNAVQDAAGNYGPSASQTGTSATYDATAPAVETFAADRAGIAPSDTVTFTLEFSEPVTGVQAADFTNTGTAGACTFAPGADTASDTRTVTVSACATTANGSTVIPRFAAGGATDAAGNTGPAAAATVANADKASYDGTAPAIASGGFTATSTATNTATATFTVTFTEAVTGLDATDFTIGGTSTTWTVTGVTGEGAGPYTVTATGTGTPSQGTVEVSFNTSAISDGAATAGANATQTSPSVIYDTVAPTSTATVTGGPSAGGQDNDTTPTFTFGGNGGGESHQCKIDSGSFAACTSPYTVSPALEDGSHTLTVRTSDAAGNGSATETTRTWTLDTTPPTAPEVKNADTTAPYPETNSTSRTVSFLPTGAVDVTGGIPNASTTLTTARIEYVGPGGSTVRCFVDGSGTDRCASPAASSGTLALGTPTALTTGAHSVVFDTGAGTLQTKVTWSVVTTGAVETRNPVDYLLADGTTSATRCKVDSGSFAACGSPASFTGLSTGDHTATIEARDTAGNTSTSTTSWTVDTTAPTDPVTISGGPAAAGSSSDSTPTFTFPSAPGLAAECKVDAGAWAACTSPYTVAPASAIAVVSGLPPARTFDTDFAFTVDAPLDNLRCTVDGTLDTTCDNPLVLTGLAPGSHTVTWDTGASTQATTITWTVVSQLPVTTAPVAPTYAPDTALADGSHTFSVRYVDPAGNGGPTTSRTWTVDKTAPASAPTTSAGPAGSSTSGDPRPQFTFAGAGAGETYECQLDGGAWAACPSPYTAPTLADGSHTLKVRIVDAAGNTGPELTRTWTVDTAAPTTTGTATLGTPSSSPTTTTSVSATLAGAGAGETYQCSLDGAAWATCTSPFTASGLADGQHTLRTRTVDAAGNVGAPSSTSWTVDTSAPASAPAPSGLPAGGTNQTSVTGSLPAPSTGSTLECKLDGAASWSPCPSPLTYSGLSAGVHTLETREVDATGNAGPVTRTTWTVDLTPPAAPTSGTGPSTTVDQTPTVTFTGEPGATFQCRIAPADWTACTSPYTVPSTLPNGSYTLETRQIDGGGNPSATTSSYPFTVDTASTAAEVAVTGTPTSPTNQTTATLTPSLAVGTGTIRCTVDGGSVQSPCPSPLALTVLAAGDHVVVFDTGPGTAQTTVRWTVDSTPPSTPQIGGQPANPTNAATATFSFSGDPNVTYECKVDSGAFAACTSPFTTGALAAGSHTFEVKAKDAAGNLSATAASATWTIDTTPPTGTATVSGGPASTTTSTSASFSFTLGADGASAECRLDGGTWAPCTSPKSYTGLAEGSHTFDVRILDAAGNASTSPTSTTWTVDNGPPTGTPTFSSQPSASSSSTRGSFAFTGATAPETYECRVDAGSWVACTSPYTTPALADGPHTFNVRIVDPAGNVGANTGSATWTVDTVAPSAPTVSGGSTGTVGSATGTLEFSAPPAGSTAECRIDEGAWAACTSPKSFTGLADGAHTAEVRFVDAAGNTSAASSRSWISDTTPPAVIPTIPTQVPASTSETSITIGVNAILDRGESVECRLDGGAWAACTPPATYTGLADGPHTFSTRAVDGAGNATEPASVTWTVDRTPPPAPTISSGVSQGGTAGPTPTITIPTQPGDVVECRVNSTSGSPLAFGPCPVPYTVSPALPPGTNTIEFQVTDAAGNVGPTTTVTFTVDDTPPPAPTIASGPSGTVASVAAAFTFTSSEAGATFVCSLDGGAYAACPSPKTYTDVGADGSHTFSVKAVDAYGNQGPATTRTWTVDTTGPQTPPTVTGAPTGTVTTATATLTIATNEAGATLECSTNGAAYVACTSPLTLSGLSDGTQTIRIRQVDAVGNPGAVTTSSWTVDTLGPISAPTVTGVPSGITAATSYTATFTGAAAGETYQCSTDGGANWATCTSPRAVTGLEDGTQQFAVRLLDGPGNPGPASSFLWVIETGPPAAPPTSGAVPPATTSATPSFTFAGGTTTTFECRIDGGTWAACTSPYTPPAGLPTGAHTFEVRQVNGTGTGPISTTPFVVDPSAPPEVAVTGVPSSPTRSSSASLSLTVESGATLWCKIDDGAMAVCASAVAPSPMPASGEPVTYALPLNGLSDGTHTVSVYQVDAAGLQSSTTTVVWRVDTTVPVLPAINGQPSAYTSGTNAQFTFTAEPGTTTECSIDNAAFTACTSPVSLSGLAEGEHSLQLRATDAAGNISSPTDPVTFTVDRTAPTTPPEITSGPDSVSTAAVGTFNFTLPGGPLNAATAECSYDDGPWTACTSPHQVSSIGVGAHTLRVRAVDAAGNVGSGFDTHSWTRAVPTTPPAGTVGVQINAGAEYATSPSVILNLIWPANALYVEISNTIDFTSPQREVISTATAWTLDASAPTVYVRFLDASLARVGSASYSDSITLDTVAPVVSALDFARTASGVSVRPTASDEGSGMASWQATLRTAAPGDQIPAATETTEIGMKTATTVYVRATDRAGNVSAWFSAAPAASLFPPPDPAKPGTITIAEHVVVDTTPEVDDSGNATIPLSCEIGGGTCRVTIELESGGRSIGASRVTLREGASRDLPVRLSPEAQRELAERGSLGVRMIVRATTAAGTETRRISVRLEAPLSANQRLLRGKRASATRAWVLAQCGGAAPLSCQGRIQIVTLRTYTINGRRARVVLGSGAVKGPAGTPLTVAIKLRPATKTLLGRFGFVPVRAVWTLPTKARAKLKKGQKPFMTSRAFRVPTRVLKLKPLLVRQTMLPSGWRPAGENPDVRTVFRGRTEAQIAAIRTDLRRFLQLTYAGPQGGQWLTTEGYVYRDAAAAQRGLEAVLDVAKSRGPIETARAFQFQTLPLPADLQAKGLLVTTTADGVERAFQFWCWRQVNMVFCNRTPAAESYLLPQVTNQQLAIIKRNVLR